jgi:hypothetical protein
VQLTAATHALRRRPRTLQRCARARACVRVCVGARASPPSVWVLHAHKPPLLGGCMIGAPAAHVISLLLDLPDHARATPPGQPPPPLPPRPHPHHMTQHKNTGQPRRGRCDGLP